MTDEELRRFIDGEGSDITPEYANRRLAQLKGNGVSAAASVMHEYSHYSFAEACRTAKPKKYLISGHVQANALHMTYGEAASGKTFLVLDQALTIACEEIDTWQGRHVNHGQVVYFAGEASEGVKIRCAAWANERGINPEKVKMTIIDEVFDFDDDTDTVHTLENTIANIEAFAPSPVYIVIDTLHAFMHGDENQAKDTKKFLAMCRKLIRKFGCALMLIHHVGVSTDAKERGRGSSSWRGAMDIEILVKQEDSNDSGITCRISQKKHKDGKKCRPFTLKMNEVVLPGLFDEEERPVTTLVPETESTIVTESIKDKGRKVSKTLNRAFKTFKEAAIRHGRISVDNSTGNSFVDITLEEWREVAYEILDVEKGAQRQAFNRAKSALIEDCEPPIITHYKKEGTTYYRLAHNGENETEFRRGVFEAVIRRMDEQKESEKGTDDETDTTGNLFGDSNCE